MLLLLDQLTNKHIQLLNLYHRYKVPLLVKLMVSLVLRIRAWAFWAKGINMPSSKQCSNIGSTPNLSSYFLIAFKPHICYEFVVVDQFCWDIIDLQHCICSIFFNNQVRVNYHITGIEMFAFILGPISSYKPS